MIYLLFVFFGRLSSPPLSPSEAKKFKKPKVFKTDGVFLPILDKDNFPKHEKVSIKRGYKVSVVVNMPEETNRKLRELMSVLYDNNVGSLSKTVEKAIVHV